MKKKSKKFPDRDWTRDLPRGSTSRASHSVQGPLSSWSGREDVTEFKTACGGLSGLCNLGDSSQSGGSTRVVYFVPLNLQIWTGK